MAQYELNLRDYIRIISKRRYIIIIAPVLLIIVTFFTLPKESVIYKSSTTIKIEERKTIAGLLTEELLYNPADIMESETKLITSYSVMKGVALKLGMIKEDSAVEQVNSAVGAIQGSVETERLGNTNMIKITVTADSEKKAVDLANMVADVYIQESYMEKAKQFTQARKFIEDQLTGLDERNKVIDDSMKKIGEGVKNIKLSEPIQQKLFDLQLQLSELQQKYTDRHPSIMQIKEQVKQLERQVQGFSGQEMEYSRLMREAEVNKKLYTMLKEKLEEARITEAQKVADVSVVDPAVGSTTPITVNAKSKLLIGLFTGLIIGLAVAFILETLDTSIGTIEDVENVVKLSVIGIIPSFGEESEKEKGFIWRIKNQVSPKHKTEEEERLTRLVVHYKPHSPISEAYRNIYTNLKLNVSRKTVMFTSAGPREGKSTLACNLALVCCQVGLKTLLVSTDLRRPVVSKAFGISNEPGLKDIVMGLISLDDALKNITDIMLGNMKFEDVRKTPGIENIWILPSGKPSDNPVELLESKKLDETIAILRSRFDIILFDSPPVLPVTDASILAPKMDCVVLVYEIGRTSREALIRAKVQLESAGSKIAGVILNHTRTQIQALPAYPYYYNYKYNYDSTGEDAKKTKKTKSV